MTVEETLVECLSVEPALSSVAAYPEIAQGPAPYIVYTQFAGTRPTSFKGTGALANPRFQIDVYASTKEQVIALKNGVRKAIESSPALNAVFLNEGSGYEADTQLFRHRQDFSMWFNEA